MKKKLLLGLSAGLLLAFSSIAYASDKLEVYLFPVKVAFEGVEKKLDDDYLVLNYKGYAYLPVRFVTDNLNAHVQYNDEKQVIEIYKMDTRVGTPLVNEDQAKLVGYESAGLKKINSVAYRALSEEERKLMPEQAKHLTPVYYVIDGITQEDEQVTLFVSSNNKAHFFTIPIISDSD